MGVGSVGGGRRWEVELEGVSWKVGGGGGRCELDGGSGGGRLRWMWKVEVGRWEVGVGRLRWMWKV